jgi:hypothetical protein
MTATASSSSSSTSTRIRTRTMIPFSQGNFGTGKIVCTVGGRNGRQSHSRRRTNTIGTGIFQQRHLKWFNILPTANDHHSMHTVAGCVVDRCFDG